MAGLHRKRNEERERKLRNPVKIFKRIFRVCLNYKYRQSWLRLRQCHALPSLVLLLPLLELWLRSFAVHLCVLIMCHLNDFSGHLI